MIKWEAWEEFFKSLNLSFFIKWNMMTKKKTFNPSYYFIMGTVNMDKLNT